MQTEIWKDVPEYEGLYQVSSLGGVKSMPKIKPNKLTGGYSHFKGKIIKPAITGSGYYSVSLCKGIKITTKSVHRLKALVFIPNPENKKTINHRDGVKTNNANHSDGNDNIEWATYSENMQHAYDNKLRPSLNKPIIQINLKGEIINEFASTTIASNELKIQGSSISSCCNGKRNFAGGYKWKFKI